MIILTIKKSNGDVYWVERFKTTAEKNKWLASEQAKPYWSDDFTLEVVDRTTDIAAAEQAAKDAFNTKIGNIETAAAKLVGIGGLTAAEVNALFGTRLS